MFEIAAGVELLCFFHACDHLPPNDPSLHLQRGTQTPKKTRSVTRILTDKAVFGANLLTRWDGCRCRVRWRRVYLRHHTIGPNMAGQGALLPQTINRPPA